MADHSWSFSQELFSQVFHKFHKMVLLVSMKIVLCTRGSVLSLRIDDSSRKLKKQGETSAVLGFLIDYLMSDDKSTQKHT